MSVAEPNDSSRVPRARLSQIAARKLSAFSTPCRLRPDGETLEGELVLASGAVVHPGTGRPVPRSGFVVIGHDRLSFTEPPLSGLGPVPFYDLESAQALEQRVAHALAQRLAAVKAVAERMKPFRMELQLDAERLVARGLVRTASHAFELWGGPDGVRVARAGALKGKPVELPRGVAPVSLESLATSAELEAFLTTSLPQWEAAAAAPPAEAQPRRPTLVAAAPSAQALTTGLLHRFGPDAVVTYGTRLEVSQEFDLDHVRYRFVATHERGSTFAGKVLGPSGEKWADRFDLHRFPGIPAAVADVLGVPTAAPAPPAASTTPAAGPNPPGGPAPEQLTPHPGEVWVMNVLIEQEANGEVRYVCTDTEGRPYGAARILKRADFESVFAQERGGWRLNIVVDALEGDSVVYRQLDAQRQPRGNAKTLATAILVSTFVPESAAS